MAVAPWTISPRHTATGLPAEDYEALLEIYSVEDLEEMFEVIGGFVGYRIVITADGEWLFFIAGD